MFESITFPRARTVSPFFAAITDVASSGKLVPIATIVSPIIIDGTFSFLQLHLLPKQKSLPHILKAPFL